MLYLQYTFFLENVGYRYIFIAMEEGFLRADQGLKFFPNTQKYFQ